MVVLRNMVTLDDIDEDLEDEVTSECSRYGNVSRVYVHQERHQNSDVIIKIFVVFNTPSGKFKLQLLMIFILNRS